MNYFCKNCHATCGSLGELRSHNVSGHGEVWPDSLAVYLADVTSDAYSWDAYGAKRWLACVRMLLKRGYNEREVEAILRSKYMRWAGDGALTTRHGYHNSVDLARFLDTEHGKEHRQPGGTDINELVKGTFGE